MFSPTVRAPLTLCRGVAGLEGVELRDEGVGERLERGPVLVGPPVAQRAGAVELRALVVEAVADLVADDRADAAVVDRVVGLDVEERRLEDGGREDDLVQAGVVVGVDRLRGHEPLVAVDRPPSLASWRSTSKATARRTLPSRSSGTISRAE